MPMQMDPHHAPSRKIHQKTMASSAIRRSKRDRKKTVSIYDEFSDKEGRAKDHEDEDEEDDDAISTSSHNDGDGSDVEIKPRKSRTPSKANNKNNKSSRTTSKKRTAKKKTAGGVPNANPSRQQAFNALQSLSKKVFTDEDGDLLAYKLLQATENCQNSRKRKGSGSSSFYTEGIQLLVDDILSSEARIDVELLNLIWRCIGAKTHLTNDIDDWSDEDWTATVDRAVEEIDKSEQTLLSATEKQTLGTAEFKKMYCEFWYRLAITAPVETLETVLARLMELQGAGVTDLRWAICLAVYAVGDAALETVQDLRNKMSTAERQYKAAKKTKSSRKSDVLKSQLDEWETKINDLGNIVKDNVMVFFTTRYRDASAMIRVLSIDALGRYVKMNEEFARSMYFKYVGWMLCDREASVRRASLQAIKAPFEVEGLDWKGMASVIARYTSRIVECLEDADQHVQEAAMDLLLALFHNDLLEESDSDMWTHLNSRALATSGTAKFRRDALYLVLGQLSEFDNGSFSSESHAAEQISQLSHWLAIEINPDDAGADKNQLLGGQQLDKVDLIVASLRQMPEHKKLTTYWSAFLRFLHEEERRQTGDRELDTLKQAVVLKMVSKSAEACNSAELEDLTLTMLRVLPDLLSAYKSEPVVLQNLSSLPKYFHPKAIGVSNRKKEFKALVEVLSDIFCDTTDAVVARNCCGSLCFLAETDHARKDDAIVCLQDTASSLRSHLVQCVEDEDDEKVKYCLQRLSTIAQRFSLGSLLEKTEDDPLEQLSGDIYSYVENQLKARQLKAGDEEASELNVPAIWNKQDSDCHSNVAQAICFSFDVFLALMSWELKEFIEYVDQEVEPKLRDDELAKHMAIRLRSRALNLALLSFDLSPSHEVYNAWQYSDDQENFLSVVRFRSFQAYTDICTLFPASWAKTDSPFLKACAWDPKDAMVRSGASEFIRNKLAKETHEAEGSEQSQQTIDSIALPFVRSALSTRNRFDISRALLFVAGHGKEGQELVLQMIRSLKPNFMLVLETQMLFLQSEFELWGNSEPDEPDDCPTDTQLTDYDAEVEQWDKTFQLLLTKATKLASSLGFGGHLRASETRHHMLKFIQEGLKFSFGREGDDEPLYLGVRVPFLFILAKYGKFVKSDKAMSKASEEFLNNHERAFREDPEFDSEIDAEGREMEALEEFRRSCGFGAYVSNKVAAVSMASRKKTKSLPRPRMSTGSSVSSIHSKASKDSSLDAIEEEDENKEMDIDSPSGGRQSLSSLGLAQASIASTLNTENEESNTSSHRKRKSNRTIESASDEEDPSEEENDNDMASTRKSRTSDIASPSSLFQEKGGESAGSSRKMRKTTRKSTASIRSEMSLMSPEDVDDESAGSTIASSMRPSAKTIDTPSSAGGDDQSDGSDSIGSE